jgi:hypothetical protein
VRPPHNDPSRSAAPFFSFSFFIPLVACVDALYFIYSWLSLSFVLCCCITAVSTNPV